MEDRCSAGRLTRPDGPQRYSTARDTGVSGILHSSHGLISFQLVFMRVQTSPSDVPVSTGQICSFSAVGGQANWPKRPSLSPPAPSGLSSAIHRAREAEA